MGGGNGFVVGRSLWYWALVRGELDRFGNYFGTGFGDGYTVATIMFAGTFDVPSVNGVKGPSARLGGGLEE